MATLDDGGSLFDRPRPISTASIQPQPIADTPFDLITFLGVAQKLEVEFLPITLQETGEGNARGGTSKISQVSVDGEKGFAFKRIAGDGKSKETEETVFRLLISEIIVLQQFRPGKLNQTVIAQLEGICWDILPGEGTGSVEEGNPGIANDDKVWPVLVLEASRHGDLEAFMMSPEGRSLTATERLELCLDIGDTISEMQHFNIVHGDIKSQNILIFEKSIGVYRANVIDFGYSTQFATEDDFILLPKSWPWYAPEHSKFDRFKPYQARRMDVFSLGMLWLWVIFEEYFSGLAPLPQGLHWAEHYFQTTGEIGRSKEILAELKQDNKLIMLSSRLVNAEVELSDKAQQGLIGFFYKSLQNDYDLRTSSLRESLSDLFDSQSFGSDWEARHLGNLETFQLEDCQFRVAQSIESLYQADYRLRRIIRRCLENKFSTLQKSDPDSKFGFELALCYKLGLGGCRDDRKAEEILESCGQSLKSLDRTIDWMKRIGDRDRSNAGELYRSLEGRGFLSEMQFADQCRAHGKLEEASEALVQEMKHIEFHVGTHSPLYSFHARKLVYLNQAQGPTEESSKLSLLNNEEIAQNHRREILDLEARVKRIMIRETDLHKVFTASTSVGLLLSSINRGPSDNAIELSLQKIEDIEEYRSNSSSTGFVILTTRAEIEQQIVDFRNAEERPLEVMETIKSTKDNVDPSKINVTSYLALILKSRNDWENAMELETRTVRTLKCGSEVNRLQLVIHMIELGRTYQHLERRKEALELFVELTEELKSQRGVDDESTLESMRVLALALQIQGRPLLAGQLETHIGEARRRKVVASGDQPDHSLLIVPNCVLPNGWEQRETDQGQSYWIENNTQEPTWERPDLVSALFILPAGWGFRKNNKGQVVWQNHNNRTGTLDRPDYIPRGWETREDANGQKYWVDHVLQTTTYQRPVPKSMDFFRGISTRWVPRKDEKGQIWCWVERNPSPQIEGLPSMDDERLPLVAEDAFRPPGPGEVLAKDRWPRWPKSNTQIEGLPSMDDERLPPVADFRPPGPGDVLAKDRWKRWPKKFTL